MALSLAAVDEIKRLRAAGHSYREISLATGVCRGTIANIVRGRWRIRSREPQEEPPTGPFRRCPGCGGMVLMPCQACRALAATPRPPAASSDEPDPPSIDLTGPEASRYLHIRRKRGSRARNP